MKDSSKTPSRITALRSTVNTGLRKDPVGYPLRIAKILATNPRRALRIATGKEVSPAVTYVLENRHAVYQQWIEENEPDAAALDAQRESTKALRYKPLISILTPVFNPPVDVLEELIQSVIGQTYSSFELCLGNFGDNEDVRRLLSNYAKKDPRIKHYEFTENLGISGNSNQILEKVRGEYIGLLDHDDTLAPNALYENVVKLNEDSFDLIYSDKDLMTPEGTRYEPLFKPQLSHETMLIANYVTHFDVIKTQVIRDIGGWDAKTDGAQDWDLFLRIMQVTDRIAHIPYVLYHWRVIPTSTSHSLETKPYALEGQRRAVQKYLDLNTIEAEAFHKGAELHLKWRNSALDLAPLVVILGHTNGQTNNLLRALSKSMPKDTSYELVRVNDYILEEGFLKRRAPAPTVLDFDIPASQIKKIMTRHNMFDTDRTVLFVDDRVLISKGFNYDDLAGWLSIDKVGLVGCKVVDKVTKNILDIGSHITSNGIVPIFRNCPSYYHSYLGNVEWVRNTRAVSLPLFAMKARVLSGYTFRDTTTTETLLVDMMIYASKKYRMVANPKISVEATYDPHSAVNQDQLTGAIHRQYDNTVDPYSNNNVQESNPMKLATHHESQMDVVVEVNKVSKTFRLLHEKSTSIKTLLINKFRKKHGYVVQEALKDVSLKVYKGEFLGIAGRNGSGKSTLLKVIAGIYSPNKGFVAITGKLVPFIELGVGFNPELTGRENVYLNGALLGFSRSEVTAMYDEIVEFAELEKFMDQKLKNYSSGMQVRLAFSIAIRAKSDVLVLDEVLAVGDEAFQRKCLDVFAKYKREHQTVILVTHDMNMVREYCDRAVFIDQGKVQLIGSPEEVAEAYTQANNKTISEDIIKRNLDYSDMGIQIGLYGSMGKKSTIFKQGEYMTVKLQWPEITDVKNIGVAIMKDTGEYIFGTNTHNTKISLDDRKASYTVKLDVAPANYYLSIGLFDENVKEKIRFIANGPEFNVQTNRKLTHGGLVSLKFSYGETKDKTARTAKKKKAD